MAPDKLKTLVDTFTLGEMEVGSRVALIAKGGARAYRRNLARSWPLESYRLVRCGHFDIGAAFPCTCLAQHESLHQDLCNLRICETSWSL